MRLPLLIFLFVWAGSLKAQVNLVPNPSFEENDSCPDWHNQLDRCVGWWAARITPDYYNCTGAYGVPQNNGYQYAATGSAYAGFLNFYADTSCPREILGVMLSDKINKDVKYKVGFSLSLKDRPGGGGGFYPLASTGMGAFFSNTLYNSQNEVPINNFAHFRTDVMVTDWFNNHSWTEVSGSFIADSAYAFLYIGNFFDNDNTTSQSVGNPTLGFSYYYIDDVFVMEDTTTTPIDTISHIQNLLKAKLKIFPNPAGNQITIEQLSVTGNQLSVEVYDAVGRLVLPPITIGASINNQTSSIALNLSKGVYLLRVKEKEEVVFWEKLIIE